jgi:hypothetical protein
VSEINLSDSVFLWKKKEIKKGLGFGKKIDGSLAV